MALVSKAHELPYYLSRAALRGVSSTASVPDIRTRHRGSNTYESHLDHDSCFDFVRLPGTQVARDPANADGIHVDRELGVHFAGYRYAEYLCGVQHNEYGDAWFVQRSWYQLDSIQHRHQR